MDDRSARIEREYQFELPQCSRVTTLEPVLRAIGLKVARPRRIELDDAYLETPDGWFLRAGYACRVRRANARALLGVKSLRRARGGLAVREEYEQPLPRVPARLDALPACRLGDRLRAALGGRPVRVMFRVVNERRAWRAGGPAGLEIEAAIDACEVRAGRRRQRFRVIELELLSGRPERFDAVARRFRDRAGCVPSRVSKFERGLMLLEARPPDRPRHTLRIGVL